jgi:UDP-N-acetylmuramoyl-tripeptide--D-alanyl-D-alanine ligase
MKALLQQLMSQYLFFWARFVLAERRPQIVGVTGSVGKTTTKEAIATVLMSKEAQKSLGFVGKAENNLNSELGLPLAVLRFTHSPGGSIFGWLRVFFLAPFRAFIFTTIARYPRLLILEYAADRPGDIRRLVGLAAPVVACITAIGPAHLERFGTIEAVATEKSNLIRAVSPQGLVILPRDDRRAALLKKNVQARVLTVPGRGLLLAKEMAIRVADYFKISETIARKTLKDFQSLHGRLEEKKVGSLSIIDDTYNANPLSMDLALETLVEQAPARARRVAILGEMRELGSESPTYHSEVGKMARQKVDLLIGVGQLAQNYKPDHWYSSSKLCSEAVLTFVQPKDWLLIKGSRGVHMEQVVQKITKGWKEPSERN